MSATQARAVQQDIFFPPRLGLAARIDEGSPNSVTLCHFLRHLRRRRRRRCRRRRRRARARIPGLPIDPHKVPSAQ